MAEPHAHCKEPRERRVDEWFDHLSRRGVGHQLQQRVIAPIRGSAAPAVCVHAGAKHSMHSTGWARIVSVSVQKAAHVVRRALCIEIQRSECKTKPAAAQSIPAVRASKGSGTFSGQQHQLTQSVVM